MARFTAKFVENVRPQEKRVEYADDGCRSLYLIVQPPPSGRKSWAVRYRHLGNSKKLTLGGFPALSLASARSRATAALNELDLGHDPAATKYEARKLAKQADVERKRNTIEQLAERFLEQHVRRNLRRNSQQQYTHIITE